MKSITFSITMYIMIPPPLNKYYHFYKQNYNMNYNKRNNMNLYLTRDRQHETQNSLTIYI